MPAKQRGEPYRLGRGRWGLRFYDEHGVRRRRSGFASRTEALDWYEKVERPRQLGLAVAAPDITFAVFVERYLAAHAVGREPSTIRTLTERLRYAERAFGALKLTELERRAAEIAAWTRTLPEGSRYGIVQALRQALETAARWGLTSSNPARAAGRNPAPRRPEITPFGRDEIERVAVELGPAYGPLVVFAAETALRPSEWIALEWGDIDRWEGVSRVDRTFSHGRLKGYGKTDRSRRSVPLSARALAALDSLPRRPGRLVFPAPGGGGGVKAGAGGYLDLHNFRARDWLSALDAAGLPRRRIYDLRHTAITTWLAAGLTLYEVARYAGTSARMIDLTYGHLAQGSERAAREKLDVYASRLGQGRARERGAAAPADAAETGFL